MPKPSFQLKLDRASEHLDALDRKVRAWVDGKPFSVIDEPDPEPPLEALTFHFRARRFRVERADDIPVDFAILIGDCLFNLRSALDHLALALARAYSARNGVTMTPKQVRGSAFPIFSRPMEVKDEEERIGCIDPAACAEIKALQPYHLKGDYASDPLWQIHELNCIDKHRSLSVCVVESRMCGERRIGLGINPMVVDAIQYARTNSSLHLKLNAILLRWAGIIRGETGDGGMNPELALEVLFGQSEPLAAQPIVPTLRTMFLHVSGVVVPALEKFL